MSPTHNSTRKRPSVRPSVSGMQPPAQGESVLISRRHFLYGAVGVGAAAAIGVGALALNAGDADEEEPYLTVPESSLSTLADFTALDSPDAHVQLVGSFDIPYGTLVWANDDDVAACLLPTESGSPLAQIGLLHLGSGQLDTVREEAMGKEDAFEIYDVRANSAGMVWTEANILDGTWRIYAAPLTQGTPGPIRKLDEGDSAYETPTIAVASTKAFWQLVPNTTEDPEATSKVMCASFSSGEAECLLETPRKSSTPVYGTADGIVVAPRASMQGTYYQLTRIDAGTGEVTDTCTLPQGMKPLEAGYGRHGFMFSFPDIYDYGEGISNLGTYTPMEEPGGDYSSVPWFSFARTPSAAPAWANDLLVVKSTYSVCGVDLAARQYSAIEVENGAETYGEYLASTGTHATFITYTNIDHTPVGEEKIHTCRVKVWSPLTASERAAYVPAQDDEETGTGTSSVDEATLADNELTEAAQEA